MGSSGINGRYMGIQNSIISENRHGLVWFIKQKRKTQSHWRLSISRWLPYSKQRKLKCARKTTSSTTNATNRSASSIRSCTAISTTLSYATTTTAVPATLSTTTVSTTTIPTTTLPNSTQFNKRTTNTTTRHSSLSSHLSTSTGFKTLLF